MPWLLLFYSLSNTLQDPFNEGAISPWTPEVGAWHYGTTEGLRYGIAEDTALITGGLSSTVSPELLVLRQIYEEGSLALALSGGLGVPTFGMRLAQGMWFPEDVEIPWVVVVAGGLVAGWHGEHLSLAAGVHERMVLPGQDAQILTMDHPWLDPVVAPLVHGWALSARVRAAWTQGAWEWSVDQRVSGPGGPDIDRRVIVHRDLGDRWSLGGGVATAWETYTEESRVSLAPLVSVRGQW